MTRRNFVGGYTIGVFLLGAWLHQSWQVVLFSLLPFYIVVPTVIAWIQPKSLVPLIIVAQILELLSRLPPGVMTLTVLVAWGIARLAQSSFPINLNLRFAGILALSVVLQYTVVMSSLLAVKNMMVSHIPWLIVGGSVMVSVGVIYTLCIIWREMLPHS